jgi:hypothetical protein
MRSEPGSGGASFHLPPDEHLEELDVPVTTLDEFFHHRFLNGLAAIGKDLFLDQLVETIKGGFI